MLMKKAVFLMICFAMLSSFIVAEEEFTGYFFENLPASLRIDLSHAYTETADRYMSLGYEERAESLYLMAELLMPGAGETASVSAVRDRDVERAVLYHFDKFLQAFFNENKDSALDLMANKVFVPFRDEGLTLDEMDVELTYFFEQMDMYSLNPEEIFILDSMTVEELSDGYYRVNIEIRDEYIPLFHEMTFWNKFQSYYFKEFENGWKLSAMSGTGA
jgi:hypothetical protein